MATTVSSVFQRGDLKVESFTVENSAISSLTPSLFVVTPTEEGKYPVIQFHNGFLCRNTSYSQLLEHIASHGFIVAAPQSKFTLSGTKQIQYLAEVTNWLADGLQQELDSYNNVYADLTKLGLSGHSKGGKAAFCLALGAAGISLKLKYSALIGIDPVAGFNTAIRTDPNILKYIPRSFELGIPVGVIGSGLGNQSKNLLVPPCAPDGVNHSEFFNECKPPCCYFLAKDYGHMDVLNVKSLPSVGECVCKSGKNPKELMIKGTAGIVVAFMKAYLEGDDSYLLAIVNDPNTAPIKFDPIIYVPA